MAGAGKAESVGKPGIPTPRTINFSTSHFPGQLSFAGAAFFQNAFNFTPMHESEKPISRSVPAEVPKGKVGSTALALDVMPPKAAAHPTPQIRQCYRAELDVKKTAEPIPKCRGVKLEGVSPSSIEGEKIIKQNQGKKKLWPRQQHPCCYPAYRSAPKSLGGGRRGKSGTCQESRLPGRVDLFQWQQTPSPLTDLMHLSGTTKCNAVQR